MKICILGNGFVGRSVKKIFPGKKVLVDKINGDVTEDIRNLDNRFFRKFDLVVNCLPCRYNEVVLSKIEDVNYMDFAIGNDEQPEHRMFAHKFIDNWCISCAGIAPGLDNILASFDLESGAEWIKIYLIENQIGEIGVSWGEDRFYAQEPAIIYDGQNLRKVPPFSGEEKICTSLGEITFYHALGEEVSTLRRYRKPVELKCGGSEVEAEKNNLKEQGVCREGVFGIIVKSNIRTVEVTFKKQSDLQKLDSEGTYISIPTALMGRATLEAILENNIRSGIYYPETLPPKVRRKILSKIIPYLEVIKIIQES